MRTQSAQIVAGVKNLFSKSAVELVDPSNTGGGVNKADLNKAHEMRRTLSVDKDTIGQLNPGASNTADANASRGLVHEDLTRLLAGFSDLLAVMDRSTTVTSATGKYDAETVKE
mgnify:CR=1 FL=1